MRSRLNIFSPLLRTCAAGALLLWVAAQALCFGHCNFSGRPVISAQASCHAPAPAQNSESDSCCPKPGDTSSGSSVCATLKSALVDNDSSGTTQPNLSPLYTLALFSIVLEMTATAPSATVFRPAEKHDWAFTPEVFLGPAFRSHAPPALG